MTMEGINASGRRVSLLNEDAYQQPSLPSPVSCSITSSPASSPGRSLNTPPLSRSGSSDSQDFASPSPATPKMSFERMGHHDRSLPDAATANHSYQYSGPQPYPILQQSAKVPHYLQNGVPHGDNHFSTAPKTSTKKNQYPCPVSKLYNCQDYFTTSGHAARHAKKHTGKKDAVCPECSKAFTRKDNMEQHRRTHSGGRATATAGSAKAQLDAARERKIRQQQQRRRSRSNISTEFALDPLLQSPTSSDYPMIVRYNYSHQALPPPLSRPELRRSSQEGSVDYARMTSSDVTSPHRLADISRSGSASSESMLSPSLAPALHALALAASRQ